MAQSATEEQETEGLALEGRGEGEEVPVLKMTAKQWVAGLTAIAAIAQAIYGLLALVFTLTQSTQIVSWYYTTTYTGIMGGLWVMLFLTAAIRWRWLMDYRWTIWSFMAWYTFGYAVLLAWFWHYKRHNDTKSTPTPLTEPFMSYLCANIFMLFYSIGFVTSAWSVWTMTPDAAGKSEALRTLPLNWGMTKQAFLGMGFIMYIAALLEGIWGWLFIQGYDMGPMYVPLIFYCVFGAFDIVVTIMYVVIIWYSPDKRGSGAAKLIGFFEGNWNELAQAIIFQMFFFFVNFGFWVQMWRINGTQWNQWPKWNIAAMPAEYWTVVANSTINSIFIPMVCYYWVTFMCSASDIVEYVESASAYLRSGASNIFGWNTVSPVVQIEGQEDDTELKSEWRAGRWFIFALFWAFLLYQAIAAGFVINDLLQNTYLAMHFYEWYIFADVWLSFVFVAYLVYAAVTWVYGNEATVAGSTLPVLTVKNAVTACTFGRPLLTLLFIAFLTMFSYSKVYSRYHNANKDVVGTQDPLLHTNSIYYCTLISILGYLYSSVFFVCKDILMGIAGSVFKINTGLVKVVPATFEQAVDSGRTGGMSHRVPKNQRELS